MKPIVFSNHCTTLTGSGDVGDLPVLLTHYQDLGKAIISCWRPSWLELLRLLFTRRVYVAVLGEKQPPMLVTTDDVDLRIRETNEYHAAAASC